MNEILEKLKHETFEYLTHEHNNQIKGFYDFDGYWKNKDEALKTLTDDRKKYLKELYFYMGTIELDNIKKEFKKEMKKHREYLSCHDNRSSRYREYISTLSKSTKICQENLDILMRVKFFVGCCVGYYNKEEVLKMIKNTKNDELNSTFYKDEDSRKSNAIFRLKILKTYLIDSPFVDLVNKELKEIAQKRLELNKININDLNINNMGLNTILELKELVEYE